MSHQQSDDAADEEVTQMAIIYTGTDGVDLYQLQCLHAHAMLSDMCAMKECAPACPLPFVQAVNLVCTRSSVITHDLVATYQKRVYEIAYACSRWVYMAVQRTACFIMPAMLTCMAVRDTSGNAAA